MRFLDPVRIIPRRASVAYKEFDEHKNSRLSTRRCSHSLNPPRGSAAAEESFPDRGSIDDRPSSRVRPFRGNKGSGYYNVKAGLRSTLGNPLACSVDLASPHERACSEMSTRACRARRFRCFRKIAPSLTSVARLRSRSTYWRRAARTSAVRLRCRRDDLSASSSRSFEVASSIAIFFMQRIISAMSDFAQACVLSRRLDAHTVIKREEGERHEAREEK